MKRNLGALLLAALLAFGLAQPAHAGLSQIVGSGTGGNIGSNTAGTGSTTLALTTNVDVPPGSLITVGMGLRAATVWTTCTDSAGNSYTLSSKLGTGGVSGAIAWSYTSTDLPLGGTITCTSGGSTAAKGIIAAAFSGSNSTPRDSASATATSGTSTTPVVGPTGTLSCPTGTSCEVLVGFFATLATASVTEDAAFTSLGTLTANASNVHMGFELVNANSAVTYSPVNATSGAWVAMLDAYIGNGVAGAAGGRRALLGVGK